MVGDLIGPVDEAAHRDAAEELLERVLERLPD